MVIWVVIIIGFSVDRCLRVDFGISSNIFSIFKRINHIISKRDFIKQLVWYSVSVY